MVEQELRKDGDELGVGTWETRSRAPWKDPGEVLLPSNVWNVLDCIGFGDAPKKHGMWNQMGGTTSCNTIGIFSFVF